MSGSVPAAYTRRTLQTAQRRLEEEADELERSSPNPDERQAKAVELIQNLEVTIDEMQEAVEAEDRASLAQQIERVAAQQQEIKTLAESPWEQP